MLFDGCFKTFWVRPKTHPTFERLKSNLLREYKLSYIFHHRSGKRARALHRRQKILKQPVQAQFTLMVEDIQIVGPLFVFIHFLC